MSENGSIPVAAAAQEPGHAPIWETLARRARAGDAAAFESLVRLTARTTYARIFIETGDVHRSEDLVQETYLLAWRRIGELREPEKFPGWLAALARNVVIDSIRRDGRKKRSRNSESNHLLMSMTGEKASPAESTVMLEQQRLAVAALNALPPPYREVLTLRYLAGADYDEIAAQLSLSNGSLRGLIHRGMALLRERLVGKKRIE